MNDGSPTKMPMASVIVPVYNDEAGLRACLEGLSRLDYPKDLVEVIVVDNASDPPIHNLSEYPFNIRAIRCPKPGSYAARNTGARAAIGDVFAFTDADCVPNSDWLKRGVFSLLNGEGKWVVGGDVLFFEPEKRTAIALYQFAAGFGQESNTREKNFTATANLLCTARQFALIGAFDERLLSGGDREWSWRAAGLGITLCFEPDAVVFTHPRTDFASAVRQARRVAAGRMMLHRLELDHMGPSALEKQRSAWGALVWVFTRHSLSFRERFQVLGAALVLRSVYATETLRLRFGSKPERR